MTYYPPINALNSSTINSINSGLTNLILPNSIQSIGDTAFDTCTRLNYIRINQNCQISSTAFDNLTINGDIILIGGNLTYNEASHNNSPDISFYVGSTNINETINFGTLSGWTLSYEYVEGL